MSLRTLMYVSSSQLNSSSELEQVAEIVEASATNNNAAGLTGALVFTGHFFIQVLEGTASSLTRLMEILAKDPRHSELKVVSSDELRDRRFANWGMAYVGPSILVDRRVRRLVAGTGPDEAKRVAEWLQRLLSEFEAPR